MTITEQRRAQRRTNVQYAVTRVLAESPSIAETIQKLLQSLGETLGYNMGIFWGRDDKNGSLFHKGTWQNYFPSKDVEELLSSLTTFSPEKGLPGGDEFAALLYHVNDEQAVNIAKQMVETVLQNGKYTKKPLHKRYGKHWHCALS